jgi:hypothetical protein
MFAELARLEPAQSCWAVSGDLWSPHKSTWWALGLGKGHGSGPQVGTGMGKWPSEWMDQMLGVWEVPYMEWALPRLRLKGCRRTEFCACGLGRWHWTVLYPSHQLRSAVVPTGHRFLLHHPSSSFSQERLASGSH